VNSKSHDVILSRFCWHLNHSFNCHLYYCHRRMYSPPSSDNFRHLLGFDLSLSKISNSRAEASCSACSSKISEEVHW